MSTLKIEQQLRAYLKAQQDDDRLSLAIHTTIGEALKKFEGKKLTKRSSDAIQAALNASGIFPTDPVCYFSHPGQVNIWHHTTRPHERRWIMYLCPETRPMNPDYHDSWVGEFHLAGFEYSDQCHGSAAEERIAERTLWLDKEWDRKLAEIVKNIEIVRTAWKDLDAITFDDLRYEATRLTGLKNDFNYREDE